MVLFLINLKTESLENIEFLVFRHDEAKEGALDFFSRKYILPLVITTFTERLQHPKARRSSAKVKVGHTRVVTTAPTTRIGV